MMILRGLSLLVVAAIGLWTCVTGRETVPITGRTQTVAFTREEAAEIGSQAYDRLLSGQRVVAGEQADRVAAIASRVARAAEELTALDYAWRVALVEGADANAFALPGGGIGVMTGMLDVARDDDELATVIAHEVAHVVARHGAERMTRERLKGLGMQALGLAIGDMDPATRGVLMGALGLGAQFGFDMPFSRSHEAEADYIGLLLMAEACYDPRDAPQLWRNMREAARGAPPEFLSTHPSHDSRIAALEEAMPKALEIFGESCPVAGS